MKTMKTIALAVVIVWCYACSSHSKERADLAQTEVVKTPGVLCGSCQKTIESAVKKVEGVQEVKVDVEKKTTTVKFLPAKVDIRAIESSIALAGYDANSVRRDSTAYEALDACCKVDG